MKKRIAITGANGQLGADIVDIFRKRGDQVFMINHEEIDITHSTALIQMLNAIQPDILVNTAAYHHVDLCEQFPESAMLVNTNAPTMMAYYCKQNGVKFVHFSTDYVFDGTKGSFYTEDDEPNPLNQYGLSKRLGELGVMRVNPDSLILRVSALYGKHPCRAKAGLNFVQLMLKIASEKGEVKVVRDEFVSPTSTFSIAQKLPELIDADLKGIVHLTSQGSCSWYEFAEAIFEGARTNVRLLAATSSDFPAKTPRPANSVLENAVLKNARLNEMPHWRESLRDYLQII